MTSQLSGTNLLSLISGHSKADLRSASLVLNNKRTSVRPETGYVQPYGFCAFRICLILRHQHTRTPLHDNRSNSRCPRREQHGHATRAHARIGH